MKFEHAMEELRNCKKIYRPNRSYGFDKKVNEGITIRDEFELTHEDILANDWEVQDE